MHSSPCKTTVRSAQVLWLVCLCISLSVSPVSLWCILPTVVARSSSGEGGEVYRLRSFYRFVRYVTNKGGLLPRVIYRDSSFMWNDVTRPMPHLDNSTSRRNKSGTQPMTTFVKYCYTVIILPRLYNTMMHVIRRSVTSLINNTKLTTFLWQNANTMDCYAGRV